jgi:hypothetical protein
MKLFKAHNIYLHLESDLDKQNMYFDNFNEFYFLRPRKTVTFDQVKSNHLKFDCVYRKSINI